MSKTEESTARVLKRASDRVGLWAHESPHYVTIEWPATATRSRTYATISLSDSQARWGYGTVVGQLALPIQRGRGWADRTILKLTNLIRSAPS